MKILIITPSLARKGPVIVARDIAAGLVHRGHTVEVWHLDKTGEIEFPCTTLPFRWQMRARLNEFDIVHTHSLRPDGMAWFARLLGRLKTVHVTTIHNYVEEDLSFAYGKAIAFIASKIWRTFWRRADACVTLTQHARDYYRRTQPALKLQVIYNGRPPHQPNPVNEKDLAVISKLKAKYRLIGASALVTQRKGFEQVIEAMPSLPDYAFVIVGDGPEVDNLMELAKRRHVEDRFICLGFRQNAQDFLAHFDICAMPSRSEGMPLAMLEAASSRVPIVCSEIPVFKEMFTSREVAFFTLDNVASFVQAVHTAHEKRLAQAQAAHSRFVASYSTDCMSEAYISMYQHLTGKRVLTVGSVQ
ncbi:MAG: glycosyltransferase family 4 protein [Janthinobacterium lividum]